MEQGRPRQEDKAKVIPLYEEEYRVVEENRFGGHEDQEQRVPQINDYQPFEAYKTDYGAWSSPFDAETQRIEEMIRQSEAGRGQRPEPRSERGIERSKADPDTEEKWHDGQTGYFDSRYAYQADRHNNANGPVWEGPEIVESRYVRHSRPPWIKLTAAVAGAAATGIVLGLLALSIFSGDGLTKPAVLEDLLAVGKKPAATGEEKPAAAASTQAGVKTEGIAATGSAAAQAFGNETAIGLQARSYFFLQNGSFTGRQGAEQAAEELKKKGFAAVSEQADRQYVYAGLAFDKEAAQTLGKQLQNAKVDVYLKAYALPAAAKIRWSGEAGTLKSYLDQSDKLVQMLGKLTLLHLEEAKPTPIDDATVSAVKSAHEAWASSANQVAQNAPDEAKPALQQMNNAMNAAKQSIDQYKKNPSSAMLWQAQSGMLQFLIAEKELLGLIAVPAAQ